MLVTGLAAGRDLPAARSAVNWGRSCRCTNSRALPLQCCEQQTKVEEQREGAWPPLAFKELMMLTPGDPAAMWFDPGASYGEVAPSGMFRKLAETSGGKWKECSQCPNEVKLEEVDRAYYQMR